MFCAPVLICVLTKIIKRERFLKTSLTKITYQKLPGLYNSVQDDSIWFTVIISEKWGLITQKRGTGIRPIPP